MQRIDPPAIPATLVATIAERLERLAERGDLLPPTECGDRIRATLPYVWACSTFSADACLRDADLLPWLANDGHLLEEFPADAYLRAAMASTAPGNSDDAAFMASLRRFRRRHLVRIAWRDLAGLASIETVLRELSWLADACIRVACTQATALLTQRHGAPLDEQGREASLLVLGMGKLGGGELNFSSDIDLVFAFPSHGETQGPRPLEHEEFFTRVGKRVAQLLGTPTEEGFVYRVDLRLRPFGDSGPLAVSFDAIEDYLQLHGRDWERYAYVKARPVAGEARFDELYRNVLRPFVYRRYLDFGVFESLRGMKEMIAREVERRELQQNVKLGPGGIREIEFIVQAFQLLRGGGDPRLQTRSLLEALPRLAGQKLLPAEAVEELLAAYRFLRRVENRLQQWNDEQTHELPATAHEQARLALAMGLPDWDALRRELDLHRGRVSGHFRRAVFAPAQAGAEANALAALENVLAPEYDEPRRRELLAVLEAPGAVVDALLQSLGAIGDSGYYRRLDETGRRRLHVLVPWLLRAVVGLPNPEVALGRVFGIFERIGGRTVYLALLHENPRARERLLELCAHSKFLSDQIAAFPLLLDELLDERLFESTPTRDELEQELRTRMAASNADDPEEQVDALRQVQRAAMFRIAVPDLTGRLPLMKVSDRLTDLAELIVQDSLDLAWQQITAKHGVPQCGASEATLREAGVIVVAYGKFGGIELGYGSDLDLVFLHDSAGEVQRTAGPQAIDNGVFFLRLVQRLVHVLTVHSAAGRLYEVDTRLRPSGKGGLLVQSIDGFAGYQREEAWTWEHQALLRSRAVAGTAGLRARYEALRIELLRTAVRRTTLREDVRAMRERMRTELSKSKPGQFDLKQDAGGITDVEFLAQYWSLLWADRHAELVAYSDNIRQLESLASICLVPQATVDVLTAAYRTYRQRLHHLSLEGDGNLAPAEEFAPTRAAVSEVWRGTME
ncbi:MAG: bifunctional [glutamate--ammonia ligase]-adenylyl-L-tyrosine phosphorylase/[glutamate--ammonia-ligase] adenylyltransferase [Steroidobacteraceae bacterium]